MTYKTDKNHLEIKKAILAVEGTSVCDLSSFGGGVPDLLVGYCGRNILIEIKTAKGSLTKAQIKFHNTWRGQKAVVRTVQQALDVLIKIREETSNVKTTKTCTI